MEILMNNRNIFRWIYEDLNKKQLKMFDELIELKDYLRVVEDIFKCDAYDNIDQIIPSCAYLLKKVQLYLDDTEQNWFIAVHIFIIDLVNEFFFIVEKSYNRNPQLVKSFLKKYGMLIHGLQPIIIPSIHFQPII